MEIVYAYGAFIAFFLSAVVIGALCDAALKRRAQRRQFHNVDITGLYAHNDDRYGFAPDRNEEQLVMCGGCGVSIVQGTCPGADNCKHFSPKSILGVD